MTNGRTSWVGVGVFSLLAAGCAQRAAAPTAEAKAAIDQARGLCPTDLNETQVVVTEDQDSVKLVFLTNDPSQRDALYKRVAEVGEALASVHPSVNGKGQKVQHIPYPKPELRQAAVRSDGPPREGWELVVKVPEGQTTQQVRADLDDDVRLWRTGECPIMTDESVKPEETKDWAKVDR